MENNLEIVHVSIDTLKPADYNPRKISPEDMAQLKESIARFGMVDPIILNSATERLNVVIGGHQRLRAATELGHTTIPAVFVEISDLDREKELNLRLNKNTGEWHLRSLRPFLPPFSSTQALTATTSPLSGTIISMSKETKISTLKKSLLKLLRQRPPIKLGDLILLGDHKLICGDSTDPAVLKRLFGEDKASMIYSDPVYNIKLDYNKGIGGEQSYGGTVQDDRSYDEYKEFIRKSLLAGLAVCEADAHVFYWCDQTYIGLFRTQTPLGSDVMSRIRAALNGDDLATVVRVAIGQLIARLAHGCESDITEVILVGNTVMHHLFSGCDIKPLSYAPFVSPNLGVQTFQAKDLGWSLPAACAIRFAPCIGGFVGSDILAGIIATGMAQSDDLIALVDLGTNGEIAIGNRHGIVCASTAAGPAFEAGSIRMGMRAATGAISYVSLFNGQMTSTVIGDVEPRGICGSGLVDAVAAGLRARAILPSGRIANGTKVFSVSGPVLLYQSDIRELQLAKAAIASGFKLLLKRLDATACNIKCIHLAGAFGNYVQIESALRIGLIDLGSIHAPRQLIRAAGNTALRGAKMTLLSGEAPKLPAIEHVSLAVDAGFQDEFADCIRFSEVEIQDPRAGFNGRKMGSLHA